MNFNPFDLLKNPAALKEQLNKMQENLKNITATGSSGGGLVKVTLNGKFEMVDIQIDPIAVDPRDVKMLQDLIIAATHQATDNIQEKITGAGNLAGMDMSNLFGAN
ncbi:MAG: YbaB/EbfC family nucleoid-associated protein [Spirochaetaceae bacterium]|nr:YbaB/EbfC family nucleoid-associated protein [Spirochaetaceae bacterium]MBQ7904533.1 YbaB/EbfC family nucleoid-associated protein [Spirochaetaceae bacterium]